MIANLLMSLTQVITVKRSSPPYLTTVHHFCRLCASPFYLRSLMISPNENFVSYRTLLLTAHDSIDPIAHVKYMSKTTDQTTFRWLSSSSSPYRYCFHETMAL